MLQGFGPMLLNFLLHLTIVDVETNMEPTYYINIHQRNSQPKKFSVEPIEVLIKIT